MLTKSSILLNAQNISKNFGEANVLKEVNLEIQTGEIIGLVGESGCGKTTMAKIIAGLEMADSGNLTLNNQDLFINSKRPKSLKKKIQMIFQNALGSFNPKYKIIDSLKQSLIEHKLTCTESEIKNLFTQVGLPFELEERYPHQISGGQIQRAAIARAIACKPSLLIADEPTSALDVSIRRHILNLFKDLQKQNNLSFLIITHDLLSLKGLAERIYVMKDGQIIETSSTEEILQNPQQAYTKRLIAAIPSLNPEDKTFEKFKVYK